VLRISDDAPMREDGRVRAAVLLVLLVLPLAACGGSDDGPAKELVVVVDAPFSRTPYLGTTIARGAELAAAEINASGGISTPDGQRTLRIVRSDNRLSARRSVDNVRDAVRRDAIAVITDGTGAGVAWRAAARADMPLAITFAGGRGLVDPDERPNVFRIAPSDRGIAFRFAEYLVPKGLKVALLTDDSGYGVEGDASLERAFSRNPEAVAVQITLPSTAQDLAPQVLQARRSGATALLVWAQSPTIAKAIAAARGAGWDVPVFTPPPGADPLVRQQLADHPEWVDGLTFASGRMTAEVGSGPYTTFRNSYERTFGVERVGVRTAAGQEVVQPPEYAMYSYDFTRLLAAALAQSGDDPKKLLQALEQVDVRGANGDERGFNERSHDGVVDDDVYFARFRDQTFRPVQDDPLSRTLPAISQLG
jgi:branched-chain amino acid transport system substrate-binding protein